jgi:hypothetical protein
MAKYEHCPWCWSGYWVVMPRVCDTCGGITKGEQRQAAA